MCKLMSSRLSPFIALRCFTAFMPQSLTRTEEEASDLSVTCGGAHLNFYCFSKGGGTGKLPLGEALGQAQILRVPPSFTKLENQTLSTVSPSLSFFPT